MSLEAQRVPAPSEDALGFLRDCLVEGDARSEQRARRVKRRAVAISIVVQTIALAALLLYPLLSKGERISPPNFTPIPPYQRIGANHPQAGAQRRVPRNAHPAPCRYCPPRIIPSRIVEHLSETPDDVAPVGSQIPGAPSAEGITDRTNQPAPPGNTPVEARRVERMERRRVSELQQMAQLVTRVEPIYPPLARQIRREGRVELRAIISTDGTIESLELVSGDPFFVQSAMAAVRQWRYRPTILNGSPIEVDTHITIIYTLSHP